MNEFYKKATEIQEWWKASPVEIANDMTSNIEVIDMGYSYSEHSPFVVKSKWSLEHDMYYDIHYYDAGFTWSENHNASIKTAIWHPTAQRVLWIQNESLDTDEESAYSLLTKLGLWTDQNSVYLGQYFFDVDEVALAFIMATQFHKWWNGDDWKTLINLDFNDLSKEEARHLFWTH